MKKFFMFFLMSFILITSSYALEFNAVPNPEVGTLTVSADASDLTAFEEMFKADTGYTVSQIVAIAEYNTSTDTELVQAYTTAMNSLSSKGYHYMYGSFQPYGQATRHYRRFIKTSTGFDFGVYATYNSRSTRCLLNEGDLIYITGYSKNLSTVTSSGLFKFDYVNTFHNTKLKKITSDNVWTESNGYYFEPTLCNAVGDVSVPDTPSGNYDLANILQIIKNSAEIQDNVYPYLGDYFIIPNRTVNDEQVFSIYFYHKSVNLSQFEYVYNDTLYYDLDKTSIDGIISKLTYYLGGDTLSNVVKDVQLFTLYYNSETNTGDVYLTSNRTLNELKSFVSETQPIIYTTKDIAYYSATWGETDTEWTAVADTSKDILYTEIQDNEGNVISPVIVRDNVSVSETPFERFVRIIGGIPTTILNGIKSLFVPDSEYFPSQFERLKTALNNKLPTSSIISIMETLKDVQAGEMSPITIELYGHTYTLVDFSYYEQYKPVIYNWVRGFVYFFLLLYWGSQFYKLLRGDTLSGNAFTFGQMGLKESIGFRTEGRK